MIWIGCWTGWPVASKIGAQNRISMPRKRSAILPHTKAVKRGPHTYLYFNTGEKRDGKPFYVPIGKLGDFDLGQRHSNAMAQRTKRGNAPSSLMLPELVDQFGRSADFTKRSNGTQRTYLIYLNRIAREMNTAPACDVEASDVYKLIDKMGGRPAAIDMMLLAGDQMYQWALKRKYVRHNPFAEAERKDWETEEYEPWPDEVLEAALNHGTVRLAVALLYYTAQRIGDCCNMRWTDIEDGILRIVQQKTGKELFVPVHSELAAILAGETARGLTILADAKGRKAKDQTVRWRITQFGKARGLKLVPHGLRKNAVNALLEAECSTAETSSISGQSLRMVEHYAKLRNNPRMGKAAMAKWERSANRKRHGKHALENV